MGNKSCLPRVLVVGMMGTDKGLAQICQQTVFGACSRVHVAKSSRDRCQLKLIDRIKNRAFPSSPARTSSCNDFWQCLAPISAGTCTTAPAESVWKSMPGLSSTSANHRRASSTRGRVRRSGAGHNVRPRAEGCGVFADRPVRQVGGLQGKKSGSSKQSHGKTVWNLLLRCGKQPQDSCRLAPRLIESSLLALPHPQYKVIPASWVALGNRR